MTCQFVLCYGDLEQRWIDHLCAQDTARHLEDERQADMEVEAFEPCHGADSEYVEVAVARDMRLLL